MILELATFLALAARCAPDVAPDTLLAVARHESGLAPWSLNDNTARRSLVLKTREAAEAEGSERVAHGSSVDFGLMQVNSMNFGWLGVTPSSVLDPCTNLGAGASVLKRAWAQAVVSVGEGPQTLRAALSLYNTGDMKAGIARGYVDRVEGAAPVYVVPPLTRIGLPETVTPRAPASRTPARAVPMSRLDPAVDPFGRSDRTNPFAGGATTNPFGSITPATTGERKANK